MITLEETLTALRAGARIGYLTNDENGPKILRKREDRQILPDAIFVALRDQGYLRQSTEGWSVYWYLKDGK